MALEITKICRTCLGLEGVLLSIYDNKNSSGTNGCVADMLGYLTEIPPKRFDGLPERVCIVCISEINRCYSFKIKCDNSDRTLRQLLDISEEATDEEIEDEEQEVDIKRKPYENQKEKSIMGRVKIETEEAQSADLDEMFSLQAEEELEASYFVITSEGDENENNVEKNIQNQDDVISESSIDVYHREMSEEQHQIVADGPIETVKKRALPQKKEETKCPHCPMTFVLQRNLAKHISRHHKQIAMSANAEQPTNSVEESKSNLRSTQHPAELNDTLVIEKKALTEQSTEDEPLHRYQCEQCGAGFALPKSLKIHMRQDRCTKEQYTCRKCQKVFISEENLNAHLEAHKEELSCQTCDKVFHQLEELNEHIADAHTIKKKKNQCPKCKKVFTMLSTLKDHMRIHSGEKPFLCSVCGKGFSQNANLKQHVMRHSKTKPFKCEHCPRAFVSKGELFSHLRSHTGDHPFVCEFCNSAFTTSSTLLKHKRIHTGERPYGCDFCPMRFTALNTLKNHRRTHTGEKPYKCNMCNRGFAQKSDCANHMRTHTGEKRYVCQVCGSKFVQAGCLTTHMSIHLKAELKSQLEMEAKKGMETAPSAADAVAMPMDEEIDEDQDEDEQEAEEKGSIRTLPVHLNEDELLNFAIEECSSDNEYSADS